MSSEGTPLKQALRPKGSAAPCSAHLPCTPADSSADLIMSFQAKPFWSSLSLASRSVQRHMYDASLASVRRPQPGGPSSTRWPCGRGSEAGGEARRTVVQKTPKMEAGEGRRRRKPVKEGEEGSR